MSYENKVDETQMMKVFQARVNTEIKKKNVGEVYTKQTLAKEADMPSGTLETYFRGVKNDENIPSIPSLYNAKKIADALSVTIDYLAGRDMVAEMPKQKEQTAEVLLKNLCTVIGNTNLNVSYDGNGNTFFYTNNEHIRNFCKQVGDFKDGERVNSVIGQFSGFMVVDGRLTEPGDYEKIEEERKRDDFVYRGILDGKEHDPSFRPISAQDFEDYTEETHADIAEREKLWEEMKYLKGQ